uniref:MFS transporter n=1 Tax=Phenylobacterium glaciei TaxID=2803784 RepID=A0A974P2X6_9CAUL|nr:MFS transporter [Phenylobacterium glaciei]
MLGFGIIVPLLPFYAKSFDAAPWQIGLIFGAYSVGAFFGEPLWGRLSDKYGRKPLLISTITGNCLCYLALAFAPNIWVAFAIRLVGGLAAGNGAVVQGYIADVTPPEKRARQMSYQGAAWNVGLIIGPSVGASSPTPAWAQPASAFRCSSPRPGGPLRYRHRHRHQGKPRSRGGHQPSPQPLVGHRRGRGSPRDRPHDAADLPGGLRLHRHRKPVRPLVPGPLRLGSA